MRFIAKTAASARGATALDAARGEHITFINNDDCAVLDFLEFLLDLLLEFYADVAICGVADKPFPDEKKL